MTRRDRRRVYAGVAGLVLVSVSLTVAFAALGTKRNGRSASQASPAYPNLVFPAGLPFPDAVTQADIASAEAALGWHIVRPDSCYAKDSRIATIYIGLTSNQAEIVYLDLDAQYHCPNPVNEDTGHLVLIESQSSQILTGTTTPTLTQAMQDEATSLGPSASVQTVQGVPAVLITGNYTGDCDASPASGQVGCVPAGSGNPASVSMQYDGKDLQLIGDSGWVGSVMIAIGDTVS
jgi:hypothetical protein